MRRVTREEVRTRLWVALSVLKPWQKRAIGVDLDRIRREVTDDLTHRIMGHVDGEAIIIVPSMVGPSHAPKHGRWDVDEPRPMPDLPTDYGG